MRHKKKNRNIHKYSDNRQEKWNSIIVGTAASADPSFMVVTGIAVEWTCPSMEVRVKLLSPRGAQLAILELKIRERVLST